MADFLLALNKEGDQMPKTILQKAWAETHNENLKDGSFFSAFIETEIPLIFIKLIKLEKHQIGFSINEIVQLGNQIEFSNLSSTTVQNWVKRDVKELIGPPQLGKKYTIDQVATLFIVEDLKACLDFDSIRKTLRLIFNNPTDRSDDVVGPLHFYRAYAAVFEKLHRCRPNVNMPLYAQIEQYVQEGAREQVELLKDVKDEQKDIVMNVLLTTTFTVFAAYYQTLTQKYVTATIFLQGL
nr:DUF1836 domain-containing protein [Bacillus sp. B15-48]